MHSLISTIYSHTNEHHQQQTHHHQVQWFPRHISELDLIANRTLDAGTDLEANHPGFHDGEYRKRRAKLAQQALNYRIGQEIPQTEYTEDEVKTWGIVWDQMEDLWDKVSLRRVVSLYEE
jgi:phenylalanine-4-hydroxylase